MGNGCYYNFLLDSFIGNLLKNILIVVAGLVLLVFLKSFLFFTIFIIFVLAPIHQQQVINTQNSKQSQKWVKNEKWNRAPGFCPVSLTALDFVCILFLAWHWHNRDNQLLHFVYYEITSHVLDFNMSSSARIR